MIAFMIIFIVKFFLLQTDDDFIFVPLYPVQTGIVGGANSNLQRNAKDMLSSRVSRAFCPKP